MNRAEDVTVDGELIRRVVGHGRTYTNPAPRDTSSHKTPSDTSVWSPISATAQMTKIAPKFVSVPIERAPVHGVVQEHAQVEGQGDEHQTRQYRCGACDDDEGVVPFLRSIDVGGEHHP